jgi:hypothetical protein
MTAAFLSSLKDANMIYFGREVLIVTKKSVLPFLFCRAAVIRSAKDTFTENGVQTLQNT